MLRLHFTSIIDGSSSCYRLIPRPIIHQKSNADLAAKYLLQQQCQKKTANPYAMTILAFLELFFLRLCIAILEFLRKCYTSVSWAAALLIRGGKIRQGDIKKGEKKQSN